jgi:hypothetical protein
MSVTTWGILGALIGGALGLAVALSLNLYVLGIVDWARQDFMGGGITSPFLVAAVGAVAGGFLGLIFKLSR